MSSLHKQKEDELNLIINLFRDKKDSAARLQFQRFLARDAIEYANNISRICNAYDIRIQALEAENKRVEEKLLAAKKEHDALSANSNRQWKEWADENQKLSLELDKTRKREYHHKKKLKKKPKRAIEVDMDFNGGFIKRRPGRPRKENSIVSSTVANAAKELQNV